MFSEDQKQVSAKRWNFNHL